MHDSNRKFWPYNNTTTLVKFSEEKEEAIETICKGVRSSFNAFFFLVEGCDVDMDAWAEAKMVVHQIPFQRGHGLWVVDRSTLS